MKTYPSILFCALVLLSACQTSNKQNTIQGKLEREELTIVSKIAGRIETLRIQEGDEVQKGDTLTTLDIPELKAKKAQANGAVTAANAQYQMTTKGATNNQLQQLEAKKNCLRRTICFCAKISRALKRNGTRFTYSPTAVR